jgi:Domain of unknown function (DUF4188)
MPTHTTKVDRLTVDLSSYPDLVVIYLGMRVNRLTGLKMLLGIAPHIGKSAAEKPEGLLRHENFFFSFFPVHVGMRQYWRDPDCLIKWTRSDPHRQWWQDFLRDSGGTGFWHEAYFCHGGMEAIYDDLPASIGFASFAPVVPARGPMFSAASRTNLESSPNPVVSESELYNPGQTS